MIRWILLLILLVPHFIRGQEFKRGKAEKDDRKYQPIELIGYFEGKIALLKGKTNESEFVSDLMIELYDTNSLDRVSQTAFEKCYVDQLEFFPEGVKSFGNKLLILGSGYDKNQKSNVLKYKLPDFGKSALQPEKGVELMRVPAAFFSNSQARFQIVMNGKQDRLLTLSAGYPLKSDSLQIDFTIFNEELKPIKTFHQLIPSSGYRFKVLQTVLDDRGNVELLIDWFSDGKNPRHNYSLFAFPVMSDEIVEYALDIPDKSIKDVRFALLNEDQIAVAGLYTTRNGEILPDGFFYLSINKEMARIDAKKLFEFSDVVKADGLKDAKQSFDELFENIRLTELHVSPKGELVIAMEQQSSEEICQTDFRSNMMVCSQHYYINNGVLFTVSGASEVASAKLIEKKQHLIENDRVYLSYIVQKNSSGLSVLYNLNMKDKGESKFNFPENSRLVVSVANKPLKSFENDIPAQIECGTIKNERFVYLIGDGRDGTALLRVSYQ
jgi:hypothetical protein